ncbi:hypothetical protein MOQ_008241 [Trypanosoma cruzi marinkellei]|uniref:Uncharacterized protein n=1 Tax=Trypanosoma cruzi marinkellei TaxID=85056 RepID=K2MQV2_TRYCR|nr:hypothetical protein MOQ_008241 [Trypanosoma cruzi marinkellei]
MLREESRTASSQGPSGLAPVISSASRQPLLVLHHSPKEMDSSAKKVETGSSLHSSITEFMRSPMLVIQNPEFMNSTEKSPNTHDNENLLHDVEELRRLVGTTQEEVNTLRRTVAELEAEIHANKKELLMRLYSDLSTPPPTGLDDKNVSSGTGEDIDQLLTSLRNQLLSQVRELEEQATLCKLNNTAKEEALHSLYASILAEGKNNEARKTELQAGESVCHTLRLKLQETQRRVWDYRRREAFVSAAEKKYVEQMEKIHTLREEVRACGLQLPVFGAGDDKTESVIPTCNRFCWERHCVGRQNAAKPPLLLEADGVSFDRTGRDWSEGREEGNPNDIVSRVFAFPPGVLYALQIAMSGDTGDGATEKKGAEDHGSMCPRELNFTGGGGRGLRHRARALGLSLEYQQHLEVNPYLSYSSSEERGIEREKGSSATMDGVGVMIRGRRWAVHQFQREVEAAMRALEFYDRTKVYFFDSTSPDEV